MNNDSNNDNGNNLELCAVGRPQLKLNLFIVVFGAKQTQVKPQQMLYRARNYSIIAASN